MADDPEVRRRRYAVCIAAVALAAVLLASVFGLAIPMYRRYVLDPQLLRALDESDSDQAYSLIQAGARPELRGPRGHTVLLLAAVHGHIPLLRIALARNHLVTHDRLNFPVIVDAAKDGQTESVGVLLRAGANPNARDAFGDTALMAASRYGYSEVVAALLAHGADPSDEDKYGITALEYAIESKKSGLLKPQPLEATITLLRRYDGTAPRTKPSAPGTTSRTR